MEAPLISESVVANTQLLRQRSHSTKRRVSSA
jgi:hypothetical protein